MGRTSERPASLLAALFAWESARRPFVTAIVTDTGGSTPRLAGAMMGVALDAQVGTVGGGAFELRVVDAARALLSDANRMTALVDVHLVRDLGMCCGGRMTAFLTKAEPAPRLWIFGAGHIGVELAPLALRAGFDVVVVDERQEWAAQERFPEGVEVLDADPQDLLKRRRPGPDEFAVVTTHSHPLDERLIEVLGGGGAGPDAARPRWVGLIGSRAKWAKFRARLLERGTDPAYLDAVRCPVGLDIGAATPAEIAVSIVAELVAVRRRAPRP